MPVLDVVPPALAGASAAVRCFALDLDPVVVRSDALQGTVAGFSARWSSALAVLAEDATATASSLREAAEQYASLDALLVPR